METVPKKVCSCCRIERDVADFVTGRRIALKSCSKCRSWMQRNRARNKAASSAQVPIPSAPKTTEEDGILQKSALRERDCLDDCFPQIRLIIDSAKSQDEGYHILGAFRVSLVASGEFRGRSQEIKLELERIDGFEYRLDKKSKKSCCVVTDENPFVADRWSVIDLLIWWTATNSLSWRSLVVGWWNVQISHGAWL